MPNTTKKTPVNICAERSDEAKIINLRSMPFASRNGMSHINCTAKTTHDPVR